MASLEVKVGTLTVTRTWANNVKAAEVWRRFANSRGIDATLGNQARMEATIDALVRDVLAAGRADFEAEGVEAVKTQAATEIALE